MTEAVEKEEEEKKTEEDAPKAEAKEAPKSDPPPPPKKKKEEKKHDGPPPKRILRTVYWALWFVLAPFLLACILVWALTPPSGVDHGGILGSIEGLVRRDRGKNRRASGQSSRLRAPAAAIAATLQRGARLAHAGAESSSHRD